MSPPAAAVADEKRSASAPEKSPRPALAFDTQPKPAFASNVMPFERSGTSTAATGPAHSPAPPPLSPAVVPSAPSAPVDVMALHAAYGNAALAHAATTGDIAATPPRLAPSSLLAAVTGRASTPAEAGIKGAPTKAPSEPKATTENVSAAQPIVAAGVAAAAVLPPEAQETAVEPVKTTAMPESGPALAGEPAAQTGPTPAAGQTAAGPIPGAKPALSATEGRAAIKAEPEVGPPVRSPEKIPEGAGIGPPMAGVSGDLRGAGTGPGMGARPAPPIDTSSSAGLLQSLSATPASLFPQALNPPRRLRKSKFGRRPICRRASRKSHGPLACRDRLKPREQHRPR
jgi:hypothetical protein